MTTAGAPGGAGDGGAGRLARYGRVALLAVVAAAAGILAGRLAMTPGPVEPAGFYQSAVDPAASSLPFVDQLGRPRTLAAYRGRVAILFFGFVHCPDACPTRMYELSQVVKALGDDARQVQVLMVTLDPERDTPAVLAGYVAAFDPGFAGATGTPAQVADLARAFHVAWRKVDLGGDYSIDHSVSTYLVAPSGAAVYSSGADTTREQFVAAVRQLARAAP